MNQVGVKWMDKYSVNWTWAATWRLLVIIDLLRQPTQLRHTGEHGDTIGPKWISRDRIVEILTVRRRCRRLDRFSFPGHHTTRRTTHHLPHPLSPAALTYPPPLHLFLREKDRREGRRTTESRCGPFIVLRLSFVRQRNPMKLTFISSCSSHWTFRKILDVPVRC